MTGLTEFTRRSPEWSCLKYVVIDRTLIFPLSETDIWPEDDSTIHSSQCLTSLILTVSPSPRPKFSLRPVNILYLVRLAPSKYRYEHTLSTLVTATALFQLS